MTLDTYPLAMDVPVMQRVPDAMYEFGVIRQALQHRQHDPAGEPGEITAGNAAVPAAIRWPGSRTEPGHCAFFI